MVILYTSTFYRVFVQGMNVLAGSTKPVGKEGLDPRTKHVSQKPTERALGIRNINRYARNKKHFYESSNPNDSRWRVHWSLDD